MTGTIRIGTRGSKLALTQTQWVAARLAECCPGVNTEIVIVKTTGDQVQDVPLANMGVKGIFTKELDLALLEGRVDLAVHSLKDRPVGPTEGLVLAAIPEREDPSDAFVGRVHRSLAELPSGTVVGTGSLRRRAQLLALRPDLQTTELRGNVDTRLLKLRESEELGGIILACAGVKRLGLADVVTEVLDPAVWLPAPGQGALAIAARADDASACGVAKALDHPPTRAAVTAERVLLARLGGGCHVPIGAYARIEDGRLALRGFVATAEGKHVLRGDKEGPVEEAERIGDELGVLLLERGATEILGRCVSPSQAGL